MINSFNKLPDWSRYLLLASCSIVLGVSGKDAVQSLLKDLPNSEPEPVKVSVIVRSEKTRRPLKNVEVSIVGSSKPFSLTTDDKGYAEFQVPKKSDVRLDLSKSGYLAGHTSLNLDNPKQVHEIVISVDRQAPSCFADSCTDRIPAAAQCNTDAKTANYATGDEFIQESGESNVIRIELRYSPKCHAYWAKAVSPVNSTVYLQDDSGSKYSPYPVPKDDLPDHHTEMVSGDLRVRACAQKSQGDQSPTCTGFIESSPNN